MKIKPSILIIFLLILIFRIFFIFQTPHFGDSEAYFTIRNIENIIQHKIPLFNDELSYSGRFQLFSPLFFYFLAPFYLVLGSIALKLLPALFISSLVFVTYLIASKITKNKTGVFLATLSSAFVPILIFKTLNNISIYSFLIPLIFYFIYCLITIKRRLNQAVIISFILPLIHPIALFLSLSLVIYLILAKSEALKVSKLKKEAILFFIFVTLLVQFIIYKKAFLDIGIRVVWQNIPYSMLNNYFKEINLIEAILNIGALPLIFGIYGMFYGLFKRKKNSIFLISSLIITTTALLAFKFINFNIGLVFLGISLAIISALGYERLFNHIKITKIFYLENPLKFILVLLIIFTLIVPSFLAAQKSIKNTITNEEVEALEWLKLNAENNTITLSSPEEGHYVTQIAKQKNVIDTNFLFIKSIDERYSDVASIYTTISEVKALQLLNKYQVTYIYFSERTKKIYNITKLGYIEDKACFRKSYENEKTKIYKVYC